MTPAPGLRAESGLVVGEADTAIALGSGDVPVLATPRLLALAEAATVAAVRDHLDPGQTSVGTSITLDHRAPSPLGTEVVATAELTEVAGRRLVFTVEARHPADGTPIATARVERTVVDRATFLSRLT